MGFKKGASIFFISLATIISRILGLIREQIFVFLLGATGFSDAFIVAFRIPNMLRDLFAEGALSTAFIPTFTKYLVQKSKKEAFILANYVINFLIIILSFLIILGYLFTPQIVKLIASNYTIGTEKKTLFFLTITMTKILLPFILFVSLAAVFMGILNSHKKFFISALAPALFNLTIISTGILIFVFSPNNINKVIIWSIGALFGGLVQFLIQVPFVYKLGYKYKLKIDLKLKHPGLRNIIKLMLPAVIGIAAVQINVIYNTNLAVKLTEGTLTCFYEAFRLIWLPLGIFGVAIATVSTAVISNDIANKNFSKLKENISFSLKMNSFLNIPSMTLFLTLGIPIIQLLFQHGEFTSQKTIYTYYALQIFSFALFFYAGNKILAPVFYAIKKSYIPVISSLISVSINIIVSRLTYKTLEIKGLALGISLASFTNFIILFSFFILKFGKIKYSEIIYPIFKHILCSIGMGIVGYLSYKSLINFKLLSLTLPIVISGVVYILLCYLLKVDELSKFLEIFLSKIKKR